MIKGNLYFFKDEFFDKFPNQMLLTNKPISIAKDIKSEINAKLRKILRLNKKGIYLAHANLTYMKSCLLEELNRDI